MIHTYFLYICCITLSAFHSLLASSSMDHRPTKTIRYSKLSNIGQSPLAQAAAQGDLTRIKSLLKSGIKPDEHEPNTWTPLMIAIFKEDAKIVQCLCKNKADIFLSNSFGITPLKLASMRDNKVILGLLEKRTKPKTYYS